MFHISEPEFVNRSLRLSDEVYAQVLDSVVVACVDCAVVHKDKMFLGRRTDMPAKGEYWIQGGRMQVGVDPRETVQKILRREIDLAIPIIDTIVDLNLTISYIWKDRSQPPQGHGCHMVGMYYMTTVDDECAEQLATKSPNQNFSEFEWVNIQTVAGGSDFHEGIRHLAQRILKIS